MYQADSSADEVIAEIPVCLCQALQDELYVFQYPLRQASRPYTSDLGDLKHIRIKPQFEKIEIEYEIDLER